MVNLGHSLWTYDQSLAVAGGGINYYPYYFHVHYARLDGKYERKDFIYSYKDLGNIMNVRSSYNWDLFYFGFSYTYLEIFGYKYIMSHQAGIRFDWLMSPSLVISMAPLYSQMSDGRKLFSISAQSSYYLFSELLFHISVSFGERAYYFHPDILTLYNQNETQHTVLGVRCEYIFWEPLTLLASYQSSNFDGYTVQYATIGVKGLLSF
jgi:hypothetical protein